jgi:hypothetical protein
LQGDSPVPRGGQRCCTAARSTRPHALQAPSAVHHALPVSGDATRCPCFLRLTIPHGQPWRPSLLYLPLVPGLLTAIGYASRKQRDGIIGCTFFFTRANAGKALPLPRPGPHVYLPPVPGLPTALGCASHKAGVSNGTGDRRGLCAGIGAG